MKDFFRPVKVSENVYWVGAIDWNIRDFHGYTTKRGTTYNAYLVLADKITLIDTVKAPFKEEMMSRISHLVDPRKIDYIISNHAEIDHSGCLRQVIEETDPERVFASQVGTKVLGELFSMGKEITPVKDGENLSLGNLNLTFLETRMLHWPDSMVTYLHEEQLLFSQDGFGMHLASLERFADQVNPSILEYEAATYYANILLPYSVLILKLLERVAKIGLVVKIIAPDHGPIWRDSGVKKVIDFYARWAKQEPVLKGVVVYGSMWHSTEQVARALSEGMGAGGLTVRFMSVNEFHRSDVMYELLDAGALVVGSSTLNNNILPAVADVLTYMKGLKPVNLIGAAFGSYGWSGEAVGQLEEILQTMKVELIGEGIRCKNRPDKEILNTSYNRGMLIAEKLKGKLNQVP